MDQGQDADPGKPHSETRVLHSAAGTLSLQRGELSPRTSKLEANKTNTPTQA